LFKFIGESVSHKGQKTFVFQSRISREAKFAREKRALPLLQEGAGEDLIL